MKFDCTVTVYDGDYCNFMSSHTRHCITKDNGVMIACNGVRMYARCQVEPGNYTIDIEPGDAVSLCGELHKIAYTVISIDENECVLINNRTAKIATKYPYRIALEQFSYKNERTTT